MNFPEDRISEQDRSKLRVAVKHPMSQLFVNAPNDGGACKAPAVSIIMPAYDTAEFISEALDSVFAQTFTDFEVIVINDGSPDTDELEKVLEPYLERIIYLKQENRGPSAARNAGIRYARGVYIAFLDSDDSWFPEYLSEQIKVLENSKELVMVYSDAIMCAETPFSGMRYFEVYPPRQPVTIANLLKGCAILPSHVVVRKQIVLKAGLFEEGLHLLEDVDLWLRIVHCGGKIARHERVLARHIYHAGSISFGKTAELQRAKLRVMRKVEAIPDLHEEARSAVTSEIIWLQAQLETEQGKRFLAIGDINGARSSFCKAGEMRPTVKLRLLLVGLRIAPSMTRFIAKAWQGVILGADNLRQRRKLGRNYQGP